MMTLYDYLPSRNAWKVRQLLQHLALPHRTVEVSIFEGEGRTPEFLALNPTGKVPVLQLDDGRALAESNAILSFLADGTVYLPSDPFARAKVHQWLSFEQENVEAVIGSLRHWVMTGKLARRSPELVEGKRKGCVAFARVARSRTGATPLHRRRHLHDRGHRVVRLRQSCGRGRGLARPVHRVPRVGRARGGATGVPRAIAPVFDRSAFGRGIAVNAPPVR